MDRSHVFKQFISRYPDAEEHVFKVGHNRSCSIMSRLLHGVVEVVFVGVYLPDGRFKSEHLYFEHDLRKELGAFRIAPKDALQFAMQGATTTCLTGRR